MYKSPDLLAPDLLSNPSQSCVCSGTDEDTIINIVTNRSNAQRQEIRHVFKSLLGRVSRPLHCSVRSHAVSWWADLVIFGSLQDLMADLKSELSKNLCRLIMGLMMTPAEFDAKMMKKAMEVRQSQICTLSLWWRKIGSFGTLMELLIFCHNRKSFCPVNFNCYCSRCLWQVSNGR